MQDEHEDFFGWLATLTDEQHAAACQCLFAICAELGIVTTECPATDDQEHCDRVAAELLKDIDL